MNHGYDGNVPPLPVRAVSGSYAAVIAPPQSYASKLLNGIGHHSTNSPQQQQQPPPPLHATSGSAAVGIEVQRRVEELCPGKQNGTSQQNQQRLDEGSLGSENQQQECFQPLFYQSAMLNGLNHQQELQHQEQQRPQPPWSTAQNGDANVQLTSGNIDAALGHLGAYGEVHPSLQPGALFHAGPGNNHGAQTDQFGDTEGLALHAANMEQQMNGWAAGGGGGSGGQRQLLSPLHLQLNYDNSTQSIQNVVPPQNDVYPPMHQPQQLQGSGGFTMEEFHSRMARLTLDDQRQHDQFAIVDSQLQPPPHGIDHITESVEVPSSEHVAEIVGRMGCKIKALRAKTNTYIKTPIRGEEPLFVVTGRLEDVMEAKREIECAAEHFTQIRASRRHSQGGAPAPGHVTAYVRVPLRVVGLVVGPKGATIKRIQQETHTYIITPSREREPIFEVTGLPQNVEVARREIEHHIYQRTGNMPITTDANASLSSLEFQISAAAAINAQMPQQPLSDNGNSNSNYLQRRGVAAAGSPYMTGNYAGNMQMNGGDGAGQCAAEYAANGTAQQPAAYLHPQGQRRFFGGGNGLPAASEMQALRNHGYGYAGCYATSAGGKAPTQREFGGNLSQPALQNTSFFDSLVNGNHQAQLASVGAILGNAMNGGSIGDGGIRYGGGAAGLLRSTSGPQQQQQQPHMAHSNDPYRAWSNAADTYYGYDKGQGGALGGELAQELFSAPPKSGGDRGAFLFRELFGSSGSPAGFTLNGGGSSSSGISSVGNSGGLSSTNSTSRDEGLGDSPTATNSSNGKGGSNSDPYHHLMISSIWSDLDSSVTPRNASNIETPSAHQTPQLATS